MAAKSKNRKCSGNHKKRLFVGENTFRGIWSLLKKHKGNHPNLGESITASEINPLNERNEMSCGYCDKKNGQHYKREFCSKFCRRIEGLKSRGVTVILGLDAEKIHEHSQTKNEKFDRIHWNCPHDGSGYREQTLPLILKRFFESSSKVQDKGGRIHITLAQTEEKWAFYQGYIYNITAAAESNSYSLCAKRSFGPERYPGYCHRKTKSRENALAANRLREFVFVKVDNQTDCCDQDTETDIFYGEKRKYYTRNTDNESSSYSKSATSSITSSNDDSSSSNHTYVSLSNSNNDTDTDIFGFLAISSDGTDTDVSTEFLTEMMHNLAN
ncbi:uncharacterized protein TRIADDRAFT_53956 [Trichoplax adhaerens]|uniref:25S rRNA (uridine-N(3))-methyltransferase BMT5-like domain-containing protein n=1 Tax=Trichoplax adhaerens TaxID=10228 RepID=B3RMH6_TRIAD|nr:hypothetical protein TRIADDRAFT_53956 [Trichoplax adhaerens]EDV28368.1 hypothetical protein TRIADDRAFT_53956 [Trichoplax adhaerens]|eukprot:XP_002110202.1 hypothetical protein TRIADDRAFT_53956 [Trichoplax adhaerens]